MSNDCFDVGVETVTQAPNGSVSSGVRRFGTTAVNASASAWS